MVVIGSYPMGVGREHLLWESLKIFKFNVMATVFKLNVSALALCLL